MKAFYFDWQQKRITANLGNFEHIYIIIVNVTENYPVARIDIEWVVGKKDPRIGIRFFGV